MRILDGAVGTELAKAGFALCAPNFALAANGQAPALVSQLYQSYLDAGAQSLTLNSFGLSSGLRLEQVELQEGLTQRAQEAWSLAAPFANKIPLWGALSLSTDAFPGRRLLAEARALLDAGLTRLRFETICDVEPLLARQSQLLGALDAHGAELSLSLCPVKKPMSELLRALERSDWLNHPALVAVGINCVSIREVQPALYELTRWCDARPSETSLRIEVRPHLSARSACGDWQTYACDPAGLVQAMTPMLSSLCPAQRSRLGLGTCCGGGPEHIQALRAAFSDPS